MGAVTFNAVKQEDIKIDVEKVPITDVKVEKKKDPKKACNWECDVTVNGQQVKNDQFWLMTIFIIVMILATILSVMLTIHGLKGHSNDNNPEETERQFDLFQRILEKRRQINAMLTTSGNEQNSKFLQLPIFIDAPADEMKNGFSIPTDFSKFLKAAGNLFTD